MSKEIEISPSLIYQFAKRLMYHAHPEISDQKAIDDKTEDILIAIIEGKVTIATNPAEMAKSAHPSRRDEIAEYLQRNIGELIELDKRVAKLIMDDMQAKF